MATRMTREEFKVWSGIFGVLTTNELELVEWLLDSAGRHSVIARNLSGNYVWDMDATNELAEMSGVAMSFAAFRRALG